MMNLNKIKQRKEEIFKERLALENEEKMWTKSFSEQKVRLEQAIEFFKQNKEKIERKEIKLKEEEIKSQIRENFKNKDIKSEIDNIKSLYNIKITEFTNKKKLFEEEKEKFEKLKKEQNNNIDLKRMEIEEKNLELINQNSEINKRYNVLKIKEMYLKDKYEDYERIKNIVENQEKRNIQYEKDLEIVAERINKYIEEINQKERNIEKEKNQLLIKTNEIKEKQKIIEEEKNNIEEQKAELNLRYQYLNTFSYKSPNMVLNEYNMSNINTNNDINPNKNDDYKEIVFNNPQNNFFNCGNYMKFEANRYISSVKERIENGKKLYLDNYKINETKIDIAKERLYIKKCKDKFNNKINFK